MGVHFVFLFLGAAKPGFKITGSEVVYNDSTSVKTPNSSLIEVDPNKIGIVKLIRVRAERIDNLCAANAVEPWKWDAEYSDIGNLVRDESSIYSANLPRANFYRNRLEYVFGSLSSIDAMTRTNTPGMLRPSFTDVTYAWNVAMRCDNNVELAKSCVNIPEWTPNSVYPSDQFVTYNGRLWKMRDTYSKNVLKLGVGIMPGSSALGTTTIPAGLIPPGLHTDIWLGSTQKLTEIDSEGDTVATYDLGAASIYYNATRVSADDYPSNGFMAIPSMWHLQGKCL